MSEQGRVAFEKWYNRYYAICAFDTKRQDSCEEAWNAATAEANKRIAELEGEVAELKEEFAKTSNHLVRRFGNEKEKNNQLQANNHDLREALLNYGEHTDLCDIKEHDVAVCNCGLEKALSATPTDKE